MLQVNLSTLKPPELRRLLDTTRSRGDAALSYQILKEMAARRESRGGLGLARLRRPAEPRMISVDLGDPMDRRDELPPLPAWRAPTPEPEASASASAVATPEPEPEPVPAPRQSRRRKTQPLPIVLPAAAPTAEVDVEAPPPPLEPKRPRSVWHDDPEPPKDETVSAKGWSLPRFRAPERESPRASSTLRGGAGAVFAVGIAVGGGLGWWVGGTTREAPAPPVARAALPIRGAALAPPPAPATAPAAATAAEPEPAPETPPEPAVEAPPPDLREGPLLSADATQVARDATGEAMELPAPSPEHRKAEVVREAETPPTAMVRTAAAVGNACAAAPTPADRQICADPDLQRLQRELRQAYAQALEAHEDRGLLRQRQLAWRDARNTVSERDRLARLYEQRIRKLNAATAAARQR